MSEIDLSWRFEPVAMAPSDAGWRAVLLNFDPEGTPTDIRVEPLIAWGVFHMTIHSAETGEVLFDHGNMIEGVVADTDPTGGGGTFPRCAQDLGLAYYIGPGALQPHDVEEVYRRRKRQRDERLALNTAGVRR